MEQIEGEWLAKRADALRSGWKERRKTATEMGGLWEEIWREWRRVVEMAVK